jgi:RHS repeat-associated protein
LQIFRSVHDGWQIACSLKNGKIEHRYLWGTVQDELLAMDDYWTLRDHLNTVRKVVNAKGKVVSHLEYNAFGKLISSTGEKPLFRYTGKMFDDATALQWNINRWYDSNVGRWISEDPIGFKGKDGNLFRYVINSPQMHRDTMGLQENWFDCYAGCLQHYNISLIEAVRPDLASEIRDGCADICTANPDAYQAPPNPPPSNPPQGTKLCQIVPPNQNGCGAKGGFQFPQEFVFWTFEAACNAHDLCWGTCGADKDDCDRQFRDDLYSMCEPYNSWIPPFPKLYSDCRNLAYAYYLGVSLGGQNPFDKAQKDNCIEIPANQCCPTPQVS